MKTYPKLNRITILSMLIILIIYSGCEADKKNAGDSQIPPASDHMQMHKGMDIHLPLGQPALAAMSGIVVAAGPTEASNRIIIWHPADSLYSGYYSGYWYVEPIVKAEDNVIEGQVIGYSDGSGDGIEPHLHFEIRDSHGEKIDPATILPPPE